MKSIYLRIFFSMIFGLIATAPFFIMEWVYSNGYPQGIPFAVFNFLFVVSTVFAFLFISLSQTPFKNPLKEWFFTFLLKIIAIIPFILSWTFMVSDQMPCFLGGKGC